MSQIYSDHANQVKPDVESPDPAPAEAVSSSDKDIPKKKRTKCLAYVAAFAVFQTAIIMIFILVVLKIRTPKFRIRSAALDSSSSFGTPRNPSFSLKMDVELGVKNSNFGTYKFQNSTVAFSYGGEYVGRAAVVKARAGWFGTKKLHLVAVELSSSGLTSVNGGESQLGSELSTGMVTLTVKSRLDGKAAMMFVFRKKKSVDLNCAITIGVADKAIIHISCK